MLKEAATPCGASLVYEPRPTYADWHPQALVGSEDVEAYLAELEYPRLGESLGPIPTHRPDTPSPTGILIKSGKRITNDGIWEQVFPHRAPGETDCLNYFVKGAVAPWIDDPYHEYVHGKQFALPVSWRLVWDDTRYLDGVIPDESFYLNPAITPVAPEQAETHPTAPPSSGRVAAGQPCTQSGTCWTPAKPDARRAFAQGDIMPDYPYSSYGATVWYREAE